MPVGIALALHVLAGPAIAQSIGLDNKPRPGSPVTGRSGHFSPSDPYFAGPGVRAWITNAGLTDSRSGVAVGDVIGLAGKLYAIGGSARRT
jgi:hypothetical protein